MSSEKGKEEKTTEKAEEVKKPEAAAVETKQTIRRKPSFLQYVAKYARTFVCSFVTGVSVYLFLKYYNGGALKSGFYLRPKLLTTGLNLAILSTTGAITGDIFSRIPGLRYLYYYVHPIFLTLVTPFHIALHYLFSLPIAKILKNRDLFLKTLNSGSIHRLLVFFYHDFARSFKFYIGHQTVRFTLGATFAIIQAKLFPNIKNKILIILVTIITSMVTAFTTVYVAYPIQHYVTGITWEQTKQKSISDSVVMIPVAITSKIMSWVL